MVGEVKALAAEKETQLENCSKKEKEQTDVLGMQKNTIVVSSPYPLTPPSLLLTHALLLASMISSLIA